MDSSCCSPFDHWKRKFLFDAFTAMELDLDSGGEFILAILHTIGLIFYHVI